MPPTCNIEPIRADTADDDYPKDVSVGIYIYIWLDLGVKDDFKQNALLYMNPFDFVYRHGLA